MDMRSTLLSVILLVAALNNVETAQVGKHGSHVKNLSDARRFMVPPEDEDKGEDYRLVLEQIESTLANEMYQINEMIGVLLNYAKHCAGPATDAPNVWRSKRDVAKNGTNATDASRRALFQADEGRSEIQVKLLNYIDDTFTEIENKMDALNTTKEKFSNDDIYKIGYIMSNIDTLKVNMGNIQKEVEKNKDAWSDKRILDVYDTVIKSNKALTNLLNILNVLTTSREHQP